MSLQKSYIDRWNKLWEVYFENMVRAFCKDIGLRVRKNGSWEDTWNKLKENHGRVMEIIMLN